MSQLDALSSKKAAERRIKREQPKVWEYVQRTDWTIDGILRGGHIRLSRGNRVKVTSCTSGDVMADQACLSALRRIDREDGLDDRPAPRTADAETEARRAAARARNEAEVERRLQVAKSLATTTNATPMNTTRIEAKMPTTAAPGGGVAAAAKRSARRSPKREKAEKWARWFLRERGATDSVKLAAAASAAGHRWTTVKAAMRDMGVRVERRGPKLPALYHPPVSAFTPPAAPTSEPDAVPEAVPVVADVVRLPLVTQRADEPRADAMEAVLAREWGRLEGMAAVAGRVLGHDLLHEQVLRVQSVSEAAS